MSLRLHSRYAPSTFPYQTGLTNYWRLGDGVDVVGSDDFAETAGPTWVSGKNGNAVDTSSVAQSYLATASLPAALNGGAYTISAWVYVPSGLVAADTRKSPIAISGSAYVGIDYTYHFSGTYLIFTHQRRAVGVAAGQGAGPQFPVPYAEDSWYHIVATFDEAVGVMCYANGVAGTLNSTTAAKTRMGLTAEFRIGRFNTTYYSMRVDEVGIWDFSADQDMVDGLYNAGAGVFY